MKVYFLTEGSKHIGFGHITRCLSLYQAFEERGIKSKFIINGDESILDIIKKTDYKILDWLKNRDEVLKKIKNADIVVIDSYLADKEFYKSSSKLVKIPVYIDDFKRIEYPRGVVVNGSIYAKKLNYPEKNDVIYLLGTDYIPLRKSFWEVEEKEIKNTVQSIMITFGGDDMRNMTPKVLKVVNNHYPELKKHVIIGKGFTNVEEIKTVVNKNTELVFYPDAEGMKRIMLNCDLAISAGGQTLYELARVGVPTIAISIAENQMGNVKGWERAGFIKYAGWWEDKNVLEKVMFFIEELQSKEERERRSLIGRKFVDGKGSRRVIDFVLNLYRKRR